MIMKYYYDGLNVLFEKDASSFTRKSYTRALGFPGGIGGIVFAIALAFGLAGKDIASRYLDVLNLKRPDHK